MSMDRIGWGPINSHSNVKMDTDWAGASMHFRISPKNLPFFHNWKNRVMKSLSRIAFGLEHWERISLPAETAME